ncbi:hypothetical protein JHK85_036766 [Glycine max]|nr:hypothetical protein JHK85_036766 [Glycine max]
MATKSGSNYRETENEKALVSDERRMSGGTVMGSFAPYQAFAVGGPSSVRGYGEGAVGVGQSCLVSTSELSSIPLCSLCKSTVKGRSHSSITSSYGDGNDASTHTVSLDAKTRKIECSGDGLGHVLSAPVHPDSSKILA